MKQITLEFTNDQSEVLDHISHMCEKSTADFIKEALICLLPLNEYIAAKNDLIVSRNNHEFEDVKTKKLVTERIHNINISTSTRLKRIGIM